MSSRREFGPSDLAFATRLVGHPKIHAAAALVPDAREIHGHKYREHPAWMFVAFHVLVATGRGGKNGGARAVDRFLRDDTTWMKLVMRSRRLFPNEPEKWLPKTPMSRGQYEYLRNIVVARGLLEAMDEVVMASGVDAAAHIHLNEGSVSWSCPDPESVVEADGKYIAPKSHWAPGTEYVDKKTGEIRTRKSCTDLGWFSHHNPKTGEKLVSTGLKFVNLSARRPEAIHERVVFAMVPQYKGQEVRTALAQVGRLLEAGYRPQVLAYDRAKRGKHDRELMTQYGMLGISPMVAKSVKGDLRIPKEGPAGFGTYFHPESLEGISPLAQHGEKLAIYQVDGQVHLPMLNADGKRYLVDLGVPEIEHRESTSAAGRTTHRFYGVYNVPGNRGTLRVRYIGDAADAAAKFNREENVRPFPRPTDPKDFPDSVFRKVYGPRQDAECINSMIESRLAGHAKRARTWTMERERFDLQGFALGINILAEMAYDWRMEQEARTSATAPPGAKQLTLVA